MDEKYEQCSEQNSSTATLTEMSTDNQVVPDDLKTKRAEHAEERRAGRTPSSLDLPVFDVDSLIAQYQSKPPELLSAAPDDPVCSEEVENQVPPESHFKDKPIFTVNDDGGRPIREMYASGPDVVVAYDDYGEPHKFPNEPITKMPPDFSQIPDWRKEQLDQDSKALIEKYAGAKTAGDTEKLDFQKIADLQKEIAQRQDLTETEKCQLYTMAQQIMYDKPIPIENWNEKPEKIDSWSGQRDPWHAVAPLDDRYHNRLVNMSPEEASKAIFEQENETEGDMHDSWFSRTAWKAAREILGINHGDISASESQVKAMRELREKGTFSAYADEWEKQYVNKDAEDPRRGQQGAGYE